MPEKTVAPTNNIQLKFGGVVLCGGRSARMGFDKSTLPFGPELMLQRVVRLLREIVTPVTVVAAKDQLLPTLPDDVLTVFDQHPDCGPLGGLYTGLTASQVHVDAVYVTSCDVPLLRPAFVRRICSLMTDYEIVVPVDQDHIHPLAGVYRTHLATRVRKLLDSQRFRPLFLIQESKSLQVSTKQLQDVDPDLSSLFNLNRPSDYLAAIQQAGLEIPASLRARLENF